MKTNKTILYSILASFLISLVLFSCKKDEDPGTVQKGEVEFGFSLKDITQGKTKSLKAVVAEPATIVVSIKDAAGTLVYDMEEVELYNMNGYFISKPLSLLVGTYTIEKFLVVDATGNVLYASPLESSALAYLVNNPLPINFSVSKDEVLKLVPEVLSTENLTPEDFGYTTFSFDIVETFDFLLSVFVYNETAQNFELTDAMLSVLAEGNNIYSDTLAAITNQIKVNDGFDSYILTVKKEGYTSYVDTFTNAELKLYFRSEDKGPLKVVLQKDDVKSISFVTDQSTLSSQIDFRLLGTDDLKLVLDWGDGNPPETISFSPDGTIHEFSHTYLSPGQYQITIHGNVDIISDLAFNDAQLISANIIEASNITSFQIANNNLLNIDISNNNKLRNLYCGGNNLTSLDVSQNPIIYLDCRDNNLSSLNISTLAFLHSLVCVNNNLTSLDVTNNPNLVLLWCRGNQLNALDLSNNPKLENLICNYNNITILDLSINEKLTHLQCSHNNISSIDISKNISLTFLMCFDNNLSTIDVSNNTILTNFSCSLNDISSINITNNTLLTNFSCSENLLTSLDISNNPNLISINLNYNSLTNINLSSNLDLEMFNFHHNQLNSLDVSNNTKLQSLEANNNNFNSITVNTILGDILSNVSLNPISGNINLQINSVPTGQGLIDKNQLINTYGWTVTTD